MKATHGKAIDMDSRGKNILITQSTFCKIAGSEMVTLELAQYLKAAGADVRIFTWFCDDPMAKIARKKGIYVTSDENDPKFKSCDYVWVHHQVLPELLLEEMHNNKQYRPKIIFFHMTGLQANIMEHPYIYDLEERVASLRLYVSEESRKMIRKLYFKKGTRVKEDIFPNPYLPQYEKWRSRKKIKKVLIVSNHPPEEVVGLKKCIGNNIEVDLIGEKAKRSVLLAPKILEQYDVVVTIGKTVQCCLAMGIPVYVYDVFGGCGYLDEINYEAAKEKNFSGRGFGKKSKEQIAKEIVDGFEANKDFSKLHKDEIKKTFSLEENVAKVFGEAKKRRVKLDDDYYYSLKAMLVMAKWNFVNNRKLEKKI